MDDNFLCCGCLRYETFTCDGGQCLDCEKRIRMDDPQYFPLYDEYTKDIEDAMQSVYDKWKAKLG